MSLSDLHIRIIKEMTSTDTSFRWNIRESYSSIAQRIGVDKEIVRRGIKQVEGPRFIKGWNLILNPTLLGRRASGVIIDVLEESKKSEIISQVELIDGIIMIMDFEGKQLQMRVFHEDEQDLSRKTQLLKSLCGAQEAIIVGTLSPSVRLKPKQTDWKIVKALSNNARQRLSDIAQSIKVSSRTVKRRLTAMTDAKTFYIIPRLNFKEIPGLSCRFLVFYSNSISKMENDGLILEKLRERLIFSFTGGNNVSAYNVLCPNMSAMDEIQRWLKSLQGIGYVKSGIFREMILPTEWLGKEIDRQISLSK